jgi:hypothetical protein
LVALAALVAAVVLAVVPRPLDKTASVDAEDVPRMDDPAIAGSARR